MDPLELAAPFLHLRVAYHAVQQHLLEATALDDGSWTRPVVLHLVNNSISKLLSSRVAHTPGFRRFPNFSVRLSATGNETAKAKNSLIASVDAFAARCLLRPRHNLGSLRPVWGYDIADYIAMVYSSISGSEAEKTSSPVRVSDRLRETPSHANLEPEPRTWLVTHSLCRMREHYGCILVDKAPLPDNGLLCSELTCLTALLRRPCDNPQRHKSGAPTTSTGAVVVWIDMALHARVVTAVLDSSAKATQPPEKTATTPIMRVSVDKTRDFSAANMDEGAWGDDLTTKWKSDLAEVLGQMAKPPEFPSLRPHATSVTPHASPPRAVASMRRSVGKREDQARNVPGSTIGSVTSSLFSGGRSNNEEDSKDIEIKTK